MVPGFCLVLLLAASAVAQGAGDLVVGFPNPNEVRVVDAPLEVEGNLIVVNSGVLRVFGTQLRVRGNIYVLHGGKAEFHAATLAFAQDYPYQRGITVANKAALWLDNTVLNCGGYNLDVAVTDTAILRYDFSSVTAGQTTTVLDNHGSVDANNSEQLGEFLYFDAARGQFAKCRNLLTWLTLPTGSTLDAALPGSLVLDDYAFPDDAGGSGGFGYRVAFDGCDGLYWGLMLEAGCDATLRDSDLLAVGALFRGAGTATVTGLVNDVTLASSRYPATDRTVRFENCHVRTWNLYSFDTFRLTVANSIFGEIIAFGRSASTVQNSICDGSGGYMAAFDDASLTLQQTQVTARLIARGRGQVITVASTINDFVPHAADNGVVALFHSSFPALPTIEPGSVAAVIAVDEPRQAATDADVPVLGSVRFLPGADVPVHFVSYWLSAAQSDNPELALWTSQPSIVQRYREALGLWDTRGFAPGDYLLSVHMRLSNDDTISIPAPVRLLEGTVGIAASERPADFRIDAVYPQPLRPGTSLTVQLSGEGPATVMLQDLLGREVGRSDGTARTRQLSTEGLAPGVYLLSARRGDLLRQRPVLIGQ